MQVSPFAPLIQLFAGIYLLFFYEPLLSKSPLHATREKIRGRYQSFIFNYFELLPPNAAQDSATLINNVWSDFLLSIRNIAALSFFYCLLVLAYIGVENSESYCSQIYAFLGINIAVIIYQCAAIIFIRRPIFHTYWTPVIYAALLMVYFHVYLGINSAFASHVYSFGPYPSASLIAVFMVFTVIAPFPIVIIKIGWNAVGLYFQQRSIERIDNNFDQLSKVMTGVCTIRDISPKLRKRLEKRAAKKFVEAGEVTQTNLYDFIKDEIVEEYTSLSKTLNGFS